MRHALDRPNITIDPLYWLLKARPISILAALALSISNPQVVRSQQEPAAAPRLLSKVAELYRASSGQIALEARAHRKVMVSGTYKETDRTYRLIEAGENLRIDMGQESFVGIARVKLASGMIVLYSSVPNTYAISNVDLPESSAFLDAVRDVGHRLVGRLRQFPDASHTIRPKGPVKFAVDGKKIELARIEIKSKLGRTTLSIDKETGLVWEIDLLAVNQQGELVDEQVRFRSIRIGPGASDDKLEIWSPPPGSTRIPVFKDNLPR